MLANGQDCWQVGLIWDYMKHGILECTGAYNSNPPRENSVLGPGSRNGVNFVPFPSLKEIAERHSIKQALCSQASCSAVEHEKDKVKAEWKTNCFLYGFNQNVLQNFVGWVSVVCFFVLRICLVIAWCIGTRL